MEGRDRELGACFLIEHDWQALAEELGVRGRVSGEYLRGGCPIHGGRDANFSMSVMSGRWNCFSSCGTGNFYKLVSRVLGVPLTSAMDWVAEHAYAVDASPESVPVAHETEWWRTWYEEATDRRLPQWWFDRGFDWDDRACFGVRWHEAKQQLIVPVWWQGQLVGTTARNLRDKPKYVNSPKLPKSELLFGGPRVTTEPIVFVVEGVFDAFWLLKYGYPAAALLGLRMSARQLELLSGARELVLALDNDEPGREAQNELVRRLGRIWPASQLTMLRYPEGRKDPSDCTEFELAAMASQRDIATEVAVCPA